MKPEGPRPLYTFPSMSYTKIRYQAQGVSSWTSPPGIPSERKGCNRCGIPQILESVVKESLEACWWVKPNDSDEGMFTASIIHRQPGSHKPWILFKEISSHEILQARRGFVSWSKWVTIHSDPCYNQGLFIFFRVLHPGLHLVEVRSCLEVA